MLDNNLILLIAIGVIVFLIMNLNANKSSRSKKNSKLKKNYENFEENAYPVTFAPSDNYPKNKSPNRIAPSPALNNELNKSYIANLKGSPAPAGFDSNEVNINVANYGQGYSLGVNTNDPLLSKFTSQAPPQNKSLISDDLLPKQSEDWFETPSVGTKIDDANLLADAIFRTGVDTIGSSRKNPSYDIRGNIANPKFAVSPFNNSSYEPDNNLRGFCY